MPKRLYSARKNPKKITVEGMYLKLQHLYLLLRDMGYFKEKLGATATYMPDSAKHEAALELNFQPFPITGWSSAAITLENIFDVIEFLYNHVSKPGPLVQMTSDTGWQYEDYENYDGNLGRVEYRRRVNSFLCDCGEGFELKETGEIYAMPEHNLKSILEAEIVPFDEKNVDSKVRGAILKWRNRELSLAERKAAIVDMAHVFEWLKTNGLCKVLTKSDTGDLFNIANNFHIRHHNPNQKTNYDENIWYSWMFHFYLATYHAAIRLILKSRAVGERTVSQ